MQTRFRDWSYFACKKGMLFLLGIESNECRIKDQDARFNEMSESCEGYEEKRYEVVMLERGKRRFAWRC